jgi:hypothetical protein
MTKQPTPAVVSTRVEDRIVQVATFKDPTAEAGKLQELYKSFIEAREQAGQDRVAFDRFAKLVSTQVRAIQSKGASEVAFRVSIEDGKVAFTARAMRVEND